jgi:TusA-related sulfurtransferase
MKDAKTVDARGLSCPQPALLARKALDSISGGIVHVLVDSATARDNIVRVAEKAGIKATVLNMPDGSFQLSMTK